MRVLLAAALLLRASDAAYGCCDGPPTPEQTNPIGVQRIHKVTLAVANLTETAAWWSGAFGFTAGAPFAAPSGTVQRLQLFDGGITIELLQAHEPPRPAHVLPPPYNHTTTHGMISQFSFRVYDVDVALAILATRGVPKAAPTFPNPLLQLYLGWVRDPTTGVLVELLQPFDKNASHVDPAQNPLGLLGFNQVTKCVANTTLTQAWHRTVLNTVLPYRFHVDLLAAFGTIVEIAQADSHFRVEAIYNATAVPLPAAARRPAYPLQASVVGVASYAVSVAQDIHAARANVAARALALGTAAPSEVYAPGGAWGPPSFFVEDADGVLVEMVSLS